MSTRPSCANCRREQREEDHTELRDWAFPSFARSPPAFASLLAYVVGRWLAREAAKFRDAARLEGEGVP